MCLSMFKFNKFTYIFTGTLSNLMCSYIGTVYTQKYLFICQHVYINTYVSITRQNEKNMSSKSNLSTSLCLLNSYYLFCMIGEVLLLTNNSHLQKQLSFCLRYVVCVQFTPPPPSRPLTAFQRKTKEKKSITDIIYRGLFTQTVMKLRFMYGSCELTP